MGNTVLLATDGSPGGERALSYALDHARASREKVVLAYVIEWTPYSFNTPEENAERHSRRENEVKTARAHVVEPALKKFTDAGIETEAVVTHGHPAETLIRIAQEHGVNHIIIGRRGQSGLKSLLFGSVAGSLVQASDVPVIVVP